MSLQGLSLLSAGWLLFLLVPLSSTGLEFPSCIKSLGITLFLGTVALVRTLARGPVNRLSLVAWLLYPLAAAALLLLFVSSQSPANPLFRLRFHLSRPALDNAARTALSYEPLATPAWVGLFPVRRIDVYRPEVRFVSEGCGVIDECGLASVPDPVPAGRSKTRLKHLGGPWYLLYSVF